MFLCMAAPYDVKNPASWSGTPFSVYRSLIEKGIKIDSYDLSQYHNNKNTRYNLFKNLNIKESITKKCPVSKLGPAQFNPLNSKIFNNILKEKNFDAIIEFGGFKTHSDIPYYIYTDSSYDLHLEYTEKYGKRPFSSENYSFDSIKYAADYVRPIYKSASGIFCMSDYIADIMVNKTGVEPQKVHTVYAAPNWHGSFNQISVNNKSIDEKTTFELILTGVSYLGKGVDIAVKAIQLLNSYNTLHKFRLHICGVDNEENIVDSNIKFYGFVNKNKLIELLRISDLFVLPTRFDCFGISFIEAMHFGLPCIGRNICAMPEIIKPGYNGELISSDNPYELADTILKILGNPDSYKIYSENAMASSRNYSWKDITDKMLNIIANDLSQ